MAMEARIGAWVAADVTAAWVAARQGGDIEARTRWAVALAGSGMTWTGRAAADDEALALAVPEILRLLAARVESDGVRALWSGATGAVVRYLQREARPTEGGGWRRVRPGDGGLDGPIIRELVRGSASGRGRGGGRGG